MDAGSILCRTPPWLSLTAVQTVLAECQTFPRRVEAAPEPECRSHRQEEPEKVEEAERPDKGENDHERFSSLSDLAQILLTFLDSGRLVIPILLGSLRDRLGEVR